MESLKQIIEENKAQPTIEAEELANNECPYCWWPLAVNSEDQKSCPICGRVWR